MARKFISKYTAPEIENILDKAAKPNIIDVAELPTENINEQAIYRVTKEIKPTLQSVPNEGYVEKIYINNALSTAEVVSILESLQYSKYDSYYVLASKAPESTFLYDNSIVIEKMAETETHFIYIIAIENKDSEEPTILFISEDLSNEQITLKKGWQIPLTNEIIIRQNAMSSMGEGEHIETVGDQNDLLTNLFSLVSFESKYIVNYSIYSKDGWQDVDINGPLISVDKLPENNINEKGIYKLKTTIPGEWKGTPLIMDGKTPVETMYINTQMPAEQVCKLIDKMPLLPLSEEQFIGYICVSAFDSSAPEGGPDFAIVVIKYSAPTGESGYTIQTTWDTDKELFVYGPSVGIFDGWNPEAANSITINLPLIKTESSVEISVIDTAETRQLLSSTPFTQEPDTYSFSYHIYNGNNWEKVLAENIIDISELPIPGYSGQELPIVGPATKYYLNTKLSIAEVIAEIEKIPAEQFKYFSQLVLGVYETSQMTSSIILEKKNTNSKIDYTISIVTTNTSTPPAPQILFSTENNGWNKNLAKEEMIIEGRWVDRGYDDVSNFREKLTGIISLTPFVYYKYQSNKIYRTEIKVPEGWFSTPYPTSGSGKTAYFNLKVSPQYFLQRIASYKNLKWYDYSWFGKIIPLIMTENQAIGILNGDEGISLVDFGNLRVLLGPTGWEEGFNGEIVVSTSLLTDVAFPRVFTEDFNWLLSCEPSFHKEKEHTEYKYWQYNENSNKLDYFITNSYNFPQPIAEKELLSFNVTAQKNFFSQSTTEITIDYGKLGAIVSGVDSFREKGPIQIIVDFPQDDPTTLYPTDSIPSTVFTFTSYNYSNSADPSYPDQEYVRFNRSFNFFGHVDEKPCWLVISCSVPRGISPGDPFDESRNMNIYLDQEIPPQATENILGGIKAAPKTDAETNEIKIDTTTGKLYSKEGITAAEVDNKINTAINGVLEAKL